MTVTLLCLLALPAQCVPVHRWAIPSDTGSYIGYQGGGGALHPRHSEPPYPHEGTWGWDYQGWLLRRKVMLGWSHGRLFQGGSGRYQTDGPSANHGEKGHER